MSRLKQRYLQQVKAALQEKFGYANPMLIPGLKKIVVSMGVAEAAKDKNAIEDHVKELTALTGQLPIRMKAKTAISNFKLREGQVVGLMVTLRGVRMWDFADRFFNIVSPRIRDFRGFKRKGDGRGCYSLGVNDQQIFPEVNLDGVKRQQGMNITFVTNAGTDDEGLELLAQLGLPFKAEG
ncbi:MAG: 50S ribosomal protein L5 [Chlamydiia bacterium]